MRDSWAMMETRTESGLFDGTNEVLLFDGVAKNQVLITKIMVRNEDTLTQSPMVRIHNTDRVGEDDEYIPFIENLQLGSQETVVWDLIPYVIKPTQILEFELPEEPTTNQPIWMVSYVELYV